MSASAVTPEAVERLFDRLNQEAESGGYHLNPDKGDVRDLVHGLLVNTGRYGYPACPCRLAEGTREKDRDIICPCDYRDPDLFEYGTCYCALYVTRDILEGRKRIEPIPERRPSVDEPDKPPRTPVPDAPASAPASSPRAPFPVWRCKVCGYLCARPHPPETCPVCRAERDRFETFPLAMDYLFKASAPGPPDT